MDEEKKQEAVQDIIAGMSQNVPNFKKQIRQNTEIQEILKGSTQEEIARKLGVTRKTVHRDMEGIRERSRNFTDCKLLQALQDYDEGMNAEIKKLTELRDLENNQQNFPRIAFAIKMLETIRLNRIKMLSKLRVEGAEEAYKRITAWK